MAPSAPHPLQVLSPKADLPLKTFACYYRNFTELGSADLFAELTPSTPPQCDVLPYGWAEKAKIWDGFYWTSWTSKHWFIPTIASVMYIIMIFTLKSVMAERAKMRLQPLVIAWNFGLSFFSIGGLIYCVPHLLFNDRSGLITTGFYPSVCSHASAYGFGDVGFWVFLFIYSKLAELIDTLFLLLRKSPVILLHWYHHVTVLLYCWHSYSVRIGTGLWFASMNYTVHAIMYFYFGLTQCGEKGRKFAKKFAMLITLLQLSQMVVGIVVTVASAVYHASGVTCYVSLVNSCLGLIMYASYFVLFLQLFLNHCTPRDYSCHGSTQRFFLCTLFFAHARNAYTLTLCLCCSHVCRHLHLEGLEGEDALDAGRLLPAGVRGGGGCDEQGEGPRREALVEEALRTE